MHLCCVSCLLAASLAWSWVRQCTKILYSWPLLSLFLVPNYFVAVGENLLQDWESHTPEIVSMEITPGVESSRKAWCQSRRPGRFLLTNTRREIVSRYIWHSVSCCFATELLRLPVSWYNFQLLAGDSFLLLFWKGCMRFINKRTLRQGSNTASTVSSFRQLKTILLWRGHHSFVSTSFIPKMR